MPVDVFCTVDRLFMADPSWRPLAGGVAQRRRGRQTADRPQPLARRLLHLGRQARCTGGGDFRDLRACSGSRCSGAADGDSQVIAVPIIFPQRSAVRRPQKAEQLVEVPTVLSYAVLQQQTAEPIVDVPVPHRRRRGQEGLLKVYALDRIQQHGLWSSTLTFQFTEVACMIFLILAVQAHPQHRVMSVEKGFFGLFPGLKKSEDTRQSEP